MKVRPLLSGGGASSGLSGLEHAGKLPSEQRTRCICIIFHKDKSREPDGLHAAPGERCSRVLSRDLAQSRAGLPAGPASATGCLASWAVWAGRPGVGPSVSAVGKHTVAFMASLRRRIQVSWVPEHGQGICSKHCMASGKTAREP